MTLQRIGGLCALVCAGTYVAGFALLVTLFAPLGYGTAAVDTRAVVDLIHAGPGVLIAWNTTIYVANAMALVVVVVALSERLASASPGWSALGNGVGLIWAALVLGAGMIANVAVEQTAQLYQEGPSVAAAFWHILHTVELGLGGGNEIAGGAWILCVSIAGLAGQALPRPAAALGIVTGIGGLVTIVPTLGDIAGAVFGLGAIAWFLAIGAALLSGRDHG